MADTHKSICEKAQTWLHRNGYPLAFQELGAWNSLEFPDAIGWDFSGNCCVVEAKVSRSDFLSDQKKVHRSIPDACGGLRYYACPKGLIKPEELPEGWGLLYTSGNGLRRIVHAAAMPRDLHRELVLLISASRFRLMKFRERYDNCIVNLYGAEDHGEGEG